MDLGRFVAGAGAVGVVTAVMLIVFIRTYGDAIRPRMAAEANPYLRVAEAVREATQPGDLILATGTGWLAQEEVYIPYFSERPLLALQAVLKRERGDKEAALEYLRDYMARSWNRGSRVYILDEALASREAYEVLQERYGLGWEEARQFFQAYAPLPVRQAGAHSVWRLSPPVQAGGMAAAGQRPPRTRVLGMRQWRVEHERTPPPCAESVEATTRKLEDSDERAPGQKGDPPASANEALTRQAAG